MEYVKELKKALVGTKPEYERLRASIIKERGYNYFREAQKLAMKGLYGK